MLASLLTLTALTLPAWDAPRPRVAVDTRPPNAHEARVFGAAYCEGKPGCRVEFQPIGGDGRKLPVMNRRQPVSVAYGSFTRPSAQEVLMTLCVAESDNCDGTTLLRREGGRWKTVHHTEGVYPSECLKFRRFDGRDQLACRSNGFLMMHGQKLHLVTADARRTTRKTLVDGELRGCGEKTTTLARLGDWRRQDVNGDGRPDLVVEVDRYVLTAEKPSCPPSPDRVEGTRTLRRFGM